MPGILPMKVIKMGTSAQSRIAQACDRCRSKKIRCDGQRPTCSQCATVGFECKTSDKLSRRAFPRGYTESLEERVRVLEAEVRELKDLLDEKDEKIDMLSRLHSPPINSARCRSPRRSSTASVKSKTPEDTVAPDKGDLFKVEQPISGCDADGENAHLEGASTASTFVKAFKRTAQACGRPIDSLDTSELLPNGSKDDGHSETTVTHIDWKSPPRLLSDKLVNVFFQEWAPLFPILHRPTFLALYEKYVAHSDTVTEDAEIALLNLVFGIAAHSNPSKLPNEVDNFEAQWKPALDAITTEDTIQTLQALILAQLYFVQRSDMTQLSSYKELSISLSARLGLHRSQKRHNFGTLTCETRKKVFWTLYTVDCFTAIALGRPQQLKEDDIHCEYPVDVDDEHISEGLLDPTPSGESTRLSSAIALFRLARILSRVLEEIFPFKATYQLSLKRLSELLGELDAWNTSLAPHLRLHFVNDKPSTGTTSSRSPLLSLAYHYLRALIQRPAVCTGLGERSSSSMLTLANSSKSLIQIVQLLDERGLSFAFCVNRDELLVLSGVGLMFQGLKLEPNSKILKDNQKMLNIVMQTLDSSASSCAVGFRKALIAYGLTPAPRMVPSAERSSALCKQMQTSQPTKTQTAASENPKKKPLKVIASRFSVPDGLKKPPICDAQEQRRASVHNHVGLQFRGPASMSQPSILLRSATYEPPPISRSEPARSPESFPSRSTSTFSQPSAMQQPAHHKAKCRPRPRPATNLDYLSFNDIETMPAQSPMTVISNARNDSGPTDWEKLLGDFDNGATNFYNATYGGQAVDALRGGQCLGGSVSLTNLHHYHHYNNNDSNTSAQSAFTTTTNSNQAGSVLSFSSDEGNYSNEDFASADWNGNVGGTIDELCEALIMPEFGRDEEPVFDARWTGVLAL